MFKEFKEFILRGNVVELAVAVVIGAAFARVVAAVVSLITNVLAIPGKTKFADLQFKIRGGVIEYGAPCSTPSSTSWSWPPSSTSSSSGP